MEWFQRRTAVKLQGSFYSEFWTSLLTQASVAEPAVLHAVLALSSIHRHGTCDRPGQSTAALQHYGTAIHHLQPHFAARNRLAHRVALITCIVFTSLDLLRGHFASAFVHLQNGLQLLSSTPGGLDRDHVDDWIREVFSRIYLQISLMKFLHRGVSLPPLHDCSVDMPSGFHSIKEAWVGLEHLLLGAMALSYQARESSGDIVQDQTHLQKQIDAWQTAYEALRPRLLAQNPVHGQKADGILITYHAMTSIMAAVCLHPHDEMIFDSYTDWFSRLTSSIIAVGALTAPSPSLPQTASFDMAHSIVDMGCVVPLYYTALKCRAAGPRAQAVSFLESSFHREGVWDSTMTARIARRVMYLEGSDEVPEGRRLHDFEVKIVGEPVRTVELSGRIQDLTGGARACVGEYNLVTGRWADELNPRHSITTGGLLSSG